ncbi:MAG: aldehyde dehydrogenase family protein, partial [Oceanospirillaceae bacterium]|nr:aldehyde dehydrogenase family protein [Oceanospirillaceae bacterium]
MNEFKHFINGEYVASASGRTFENRCPVDGSLIGQVHEAGRDEVDAAVRAARAALKGPWAKLTQAQRIELLNKVANRINERFD